jgi:SpoVK/Ycf46/Vps4 family AAA+-type ATPase
MINSISAENLNLNYLNKAIDSIVEILERHVGLNVGEPKKPSSDFDFSEKNFAQSPATLDRVIHAFKLTIPERKVFLLCVAAELNPRVGELCSQVFGTQGREYPTYHVARAIFPDFHLELTGARSPLSRWKLIEPSVFSDVYWFNTPLRVNARILRYLLGNFSLDEEIQGIFKFIRGNPPQIELSESHQTIISQIGQLWGNVSSIIPIVQLCGADGASSWRLARIFSFLIEAPLYYLSPLALPSDSNQLKAIADLWQREYLLNESVLLIDCSNLARAGTPQLEGLGRFLSDINVPVILLSYERMSLAQKPVVTWDVLPLTPGEQRQIWQESLGGVAKELNSQIDELVTNFQLSHNTIATASTTALSRMGSDQKNPQKLGKELWSVCRTMARPALDELAQRIDSTAKLEDLILPERQKDVLFEMVSQIRQRTQVYENWGFAGKSRRGLGVSALFAGTSGTGKTMAAEVIALSLELDLYRIDLSTVVSKYIGETEKNLAKLFDAAESGGVILLFDEGDSLFGKRSEVKDSRDRYANLETSFLLQRLEAYRGLAIITTNLKDSLDSAFVRRLQFIVDFPFPDVNQRAEIWRRVFPSGVLEIDESKDFQKLARLNVSGGNIRSIALKSAFLAAEERSLVTMRHLLRAAKSEYAKNERTLTDAEIYGWV